MICWTWRTNGRTVLVNLQEKYCFLSPLTDKGALVQIRELELLQLARNPWVSALLVGGFVYFGEKL